MARPAGDAPAELWLGYDGLSVPYSAINALLAYQPAWDRRIASAYGCVPRDARALVLLHDGRLLPSRRSLEDLHARWSDWKAAGHDSATSRDMS